MVAVRSLGLWTALALILGVGVEARALTITHTLDQHFGSDPASGFVTATYDDGGGSGSVTLTLDSNGLDLAGEFVAAWYINFTGDPTSLSFAYEGGSSSGPAATVSTGTDSFMADGDGNFDILFDFPQGAGNRFDIDEVVVYTITGIGITAADFDDFSAAGGGQGTYLSAAKINGTCLGSPGCTDNNEGSDWVGAVPEPNATLLFGVGCLVAGIAAQRKR